MNKGKVTIKDIARELGISPSTVSKALKGHPDISDTTIKSVKELVVKWNYKPDPIALSLQRGSGNTIGVIVPEIVHYFFSTVIGGIEDLAYESGYQVMFCLSNESYEREVKAAETLIGNRVEGILVSMSKVTRNTDHFRKIADSGIPLVFFDRICEDMETDRVIVDDESGAYEATCHLIKTGCKNLIHLSGPQNLLIGKNRKNGFIRALKDHNLNVDDNNIIRCDTEDYARNIIPGLLERKPLPDGFFAVNDLTAATTMKIVKSSGYKVPDDISIVGFTSGLISDLTDPQLTSVFQDGYSVGREAVKLLFERLVSGNEKPPRTEVINTKLMIKGSTRIPLLV